MLSKDKILGIRRNVFFLGLVSFFNDLSAEMVQAVMPIFLTTALGASPAFVGFLEGAADALASILKLFSGWLSDKIKKRKLLAIVGYSLSVSARLFFSFVSSFWQLFSFRIVDRIGKGIRDAPRDALIAESVDKKELGRSFGFHRSADTLGATLGPLFALLVLPILDNNYRQFFIIAFFVGLGAILSFYFVKDNFNQSAFQIEKPKLNWNLFRTHKKFIFIVLSIFIFGLGGLPITLVMLKGPEVGIKNTSVPLLYFVYSLTFVLIALPLGKLADKIGEKWIIAGGFLLAAVAYFGLKYSITPFWVVLFFVVLGIYAAATDGLQRMLAAKLLDNHLLATGQGFLNMAVGFSSLGAGILGGILWANFGSNIALLYAGMMSLFGFALFLFIVFRPLIKSESQEEAPQVEISKN